MNCVIFTGSLFVALSGSIAGPLLTAASITVDLNNVTGKQFSPVLVNCTFTIDSQETLNTVDIQRNSGDSFITIASCNLTDWSTTTIDTSLSTTGSSGMDLQCGQGYFSVEISSASLTVSTKIKCQISSHNNVTFSVAALSVACSSVYPLSDVTDVLLGSPLLLRCTATSTSRNAVIYWQRKEHSEILSTNGNLTIQTALLSTAGWYTCHVLDSICPSDSETSTYVNVNWDVPPTSSNTTSLSKSAGDSLDLTCNVTTLPLPSVAIYFVSSQDVKNLSSSAVNTNTTLKVASRLTLGTAKPRGWAELHVTSLDVNNSGRYSCVARLPGDLYFTVATYDVTVIDDSSDSSDNSATTVSTTSAPQELFPLWKIGVFVIGADAVLIFTIVTVVVCRLKCDGKDNDTAPLDIEEEEAGDAYEPEVNVKDEDLFVPGIQRPRNAPDRYQQNALDDDEAAITRRAGVRLPPIRIDRPNIVVTDENKDEQFAPSNVANNSRRPRQLTSSE